MASLRNVAASCLLFAAAFAAEGVARAENPRVNVQAFRPSPHAGDLMSTRSTDVTGPWLWNVDLWASYAQNPLGFGDASGNFPRYEPIQDMLSLHLVGALRIADWLSVGAEVPFFAVIDGEEDGFVPLDDIPSSALGDVGLSVKVGLLRRDVGASGLGVAIELPVTLPTGDRDAFVSDGFSFTPSLLVDLRAGPLLVALNLGARVRGEEARLPFGTTIGTELVYRVGVGVDVAPELLTLLGEVYGASSNFAEENNNNVEGVLGLTAQLGSGFSTTVGVGRGFTQGYGASKLRVVARVGFALPAARDRDEDGIVDDLDPCPDAAEDIDGFEDADGCPELDNDKDGVPDTDDRCPTTPEDIDNFEDEDGCPDGDNDGDGVPDASDACPGAAEDVDGFADEDGCPDDDNDGDGVPDARDGAVDASGLGSCRDEPEDRDNFEDDDGCPDLDNDGDGVLDTVDDCPLDAENKCGITFNPCEIVIGEQIFFVTNGDGIKEQSFGLLDAIASVFLSRPVITRVEIQGHTDSMGEDDFNMDLSQRRADSVMAYLVGKGVDPSRLVARGYGETRPLGDNRRPEGRAQNRRVQFLILEPSQADCPR